MDLLKLGAQLSHDKLRERQASVDPDSAIAIFYTSGTTGLRKAATLTNFGVLNLVRAQWDLLSPYYQRVCVPIPMFHIFAEISLCCWDAIVPIDILRNEKKLFAISFVFYSHLYFVLLQNLLRI